MFKWEKGGVRPVEEDNEILMGNEYVHPKDDLLKQIAEVNRKGCRPVYKDEPRYEEHINRATLVWTGGAWQDFIGILLSNGYEVTAKCNDGIDIDVTWKDKNDLVEEIKREARKIEETL